MLSIDQNCHSLWDAVPKLDALVSAGRAVTHCVEDVDVAFTALGSAVDVPNLRIAMERFHPSGGQDWGAAMFYSSFLGRLAVEPRDWEPYTGIKTDALARHIGLTLDELYDQFSPGDTWQLIGSSYVGDREHHRVIGDLPVSQTGKFLRELIRIARQDCLDRFPQESSRQRLAQWFDAEAARLEQLLARHSGAKLVDLYADWMSQCVGGSVEIKLASSLFECGGDPCRLALLELFLRDYDRLAGMYNEAIAQSGVPMHPLHRHEGELPFFATYRHSGHLVRTGAALVGGKLRVGQHEFELGPGGKLPTEAMCQAGIVSLAGKALLLVIQARLGSNGQPLALPYRGSVYMPAAHLLQRKLSDAGLLPGDVKPVVRVRLALLDRMRELDTVIHLPHHLAAEMGKHDVPACLLAEHWSDLAAEAKTRLELFHESAFRQQWQRENLPDLAREHAALDARRRELAKVNEKDPQLRAIWKQIKPLESQMLRRLVEQISRDWQVRELDYWDSRGAILPWCIALGGREFYDYVIRSATVHEE